MFKNRFIQIKLCEDEFLVVFSIILIGSIKLYYYDGLHGNKLLSKELATPVKTRVETPERTRALVREWVSLSFYNAASTNLDELLVSACSF